MPKIVELGKWYLVIVCTACGKDVPFTEVASPQEQAKLRVRTAAVTCPHCQKKARYAPAIMTRRQAPTV
jgi:DNA-directed RNA polymerase subunit RPC12/RpoP